MTAPLSDSDKDTAREILFVVGGIGLAAALWLAVRAF